MEDLLTSDVFSDFKDLCLDLAFILRMFIDYKVYYRQFLSFPLFIERGLFSIIYTNYDDLE
ncbi:hypothetical protein B1no1_22650 [Thermolongibacillus altinsuensis]|nr:hypothetical protein B1no1_22650 [Thermolongibacillus altinsuensis]